MNFSIRFYTAKCSREDCIDGAMISSALYYKWEIWIIDASYYISVNNSRPVLPAPGAKFMLWVTIKTHKCHHCSSEGGQQQAFSYLQSWHGPNPIILRESPYTHDSVSSACNQTHSQKLSKASWGCCFWFSRLLDSKNHCNHLTRHKLQSNSSVIFMEII